MHKLEVKFWRSWHEITLTQDLTNQTLIKDRQGTKLSIKI